MAGSEPVTGRSEGVEKGQRAVLGKKTSQRRKMGKVV